MNLENLLRTIAPVLVGTWKALRCLSTAMMMENYINDVVATCMKNGSWSPDPYTYKCHKESMTDILSIHFYNDIMSYIRFLRYW